MKKTIEHIHLAAQYLAAAGISFLDKAQDDSHTNVGWNSSEARMETHVFNADNQLAINVKTAHLEWLKSGLKESEMNLQGSKHSDILVWISDQVTNNEIPKKFDYQFHYELPYANITNDYIFDFNAEALVDISNRLDLGQQVFEDFISTNKLDSPIRIWPHHFDLGIYTSLNKDASIRMGAGLAIPDSLVDDLYYYASGYNNGSAVVTKDFSGLTNGDWRADWNGATLASSGLEIDTAINFLNETKNTFLSNA